ncbi:MAG: hypothetical protein GXY48_06570 [Methanomicrobiales archaeon]|nr:hypothetical protein [Methanomicrobiales archaeon]
MTVDAIISRIEKEVEEEIQAIRNEEYCEITNIRNLAEQKAEDAYNHRISEGWREIRQLVASGESRTRIDAQRKVREAREELISDCFEETRNQLRTIRRSDKYPVLLKNLLSDCIESLGNTEIVLFVHSDDRKIALDIINSLNKEGYSLSLSPDPVLTDGGVICERVSDKVIIDNTVEARFSRMQRDMVITASSILFHSGDP